MSMLQGKRILVTGGSGFIGSHLCQRLVRIGAQVYVTVKYNSVINNVRLAGIWDEIFPVEADLRNPDSLARLRQIRPEIIFHLAAYNHVGDSFFQVSEAVDSNGKGSINLLEAYEDYARFIYISSSEVYGYQEEVPFHEDMTPNPLSPYSLGKYTGELYARMKWRVNKRPIVVLRPFNAYGPYQSTRAVVAELVTKALQNQDIVTTEGRQTREFNFVENLIDGFVLAAMVPDAVGQIINLGCGVEVSIRELAGKIHLLAQPQAQLRIGELPTRPVEIWRMCADNTRAKEILGWVPKISLEDGLAITINWYRQYLDQFSNARSQLSQLGIY